MFEIAARLDLDWHTGRLDHYIELTDTLGALKKAGFLEFPLDHDRAPRALKLLIGIEDKAYFHWQIPILFESLAGQLPDDWEVITVVCNDHRPLSDRLARIFETYDIRYYTGASHADHHDMDFAGGGDVYRPLNRIEALNVAARHVGDSDLVFLLDTDIFLYRELDLSIFPSGNAMGENWLIANKPFFSHRNGPGGVDLHALLAALGVEQPFEPGGVSVFLTGEVLRRNEFKLTRDCFRFTQLLYLAGKIVGPSDYWVSEMPCFALAATANGVEYELIDAKPFMVDKDEVIAPGTFYHYYHDPGDREGIDGAFHGSPWHKQRFFHTDLLATDLEEDYEASASDHERYFFELAMRAQRRLREVDATFDEPGVSRGATVTIVGAPTSQLDADLPSATLRKLPESSVEPSAQAANRAEDHLSIVTSRPKKNVRHLGDVDSSLFREEPVACELERPKTLNPAHPNRDWVAQPTHSLLLGVPDAYIGDGVVFDRDRFYSFGKWWLGSFDDSWKLYEETKEVREVDRALALGAWCGDLFQYFAADALPRLGLVLGLLESPAGRDLQIVTHEENASAAAWFWNKLGLRDRIVQKPTSSRSGFVIHANQAFCADSIPNPGFLGVHPRNSLRPIQERLGLLEPIERDLVLYLDENFPHTVANAPSFLPKIEELLRPTDYEVQRFRGGDDFDANMEAMRRARLVIGPHGPMLANLVFAQPQTHVIEFLPSYRLFRDGLDPRPLYWGLSQAAGLDYWTVEPQNFEFDRPGMCVDEDEVLTLIRQLLDL